MVDDGIQSNAEEARLGAQLPLWRSRRNEAVLLALAGGVVALSILLAPAEGSLQLLGWTVPPLCLWKSLTGLDCLGCGLTRSFVWMGHGDLQAAFDLHALGPPLYLAVVLQVPLRGWRLWQAQRAREPG